MSVPVRRAMLADAAELARLSAELGYPATSEQMHARLVELLPQAAHFIAVCDSPTGLHGWIAAERRLLLEYGARAEIAGLVVDARARRAGVGRALVAAAEQWARDQALDEITVRSNVVREASHPFYQRLGFVRRKTQHSYAKALR